MRLLLPIGFPLLTSCEGLTEWVASADPVVVQEKTAAAADVAGAVGGLFGMGDLASGVVTGVGGMAAIAVGWAKLTKTRSKKANPVA